ncbi:MAG: PEP-CTERM sorting domain-containing protein [Thermoguttaceae bacterium]
MNVSNLVQWFGIAALGALLLPASPAAGESVSYVSGAASIFGSSTQYGDTLLYSPTAFSSCSTGRCGVDMTSGLFRLRITSTGNIEELEVNEGGAYFFFGSRATDLTQAYVGTSAAQLLITSVNGVDVNGPLVSIAGTMEITPSSSDIGSSTFNATEPCDAAGWQGTMVFENIGAALDDTPYAGGMVTGLMLVFNDILATSSQKGTLAYIDREWVSVMTTVTPGPTSSSADSTTVPEPGTLAILATTSVLGLAWGLRKRTLDALGRRKDGLQA